MIPRFDRRSFGIRVLAMLSVIAMLGVSAACSSRKPPGASAGFDCRRIQGPLSTNKFYEDNPTFTDPVDDSASWKVSTYYHGSAKNQSNNVHSASKSIWGAAIGIAINQGRIPSADATIVSTLPSRYVAVMSPKTPAIKVRDLITMTSGIRWEEDITEDQIQQAPDWIAATLGLPRASSPGTLFNYSTGNTQLSSAVLTSATRMTACEFIHQNLLAPLGIVVEHWGRDPQGYFSGGYNFYVTPRELAKFGLLYLHDGRWNGRQLVPAAWVEASMTNQVNAGAPYSYGYNFWLRDIAGHHVAIAWGFGGQMIYLIKDLDLVVVMTTNTRDFTQDSFNGLSIIEDDVLPAAD
jgi:CubicO group peptidase (beta-lactamase class C family)